MEDQRWERTDVRRLSPPEHIQPSESHSRVETGADGRERLLVGECITWDETREVPGAREQALSWGATWCACEYMLSCYEQIGLLDEPVESLRCVSEFALREGDTPIPLLTPEGIVHWLELKGVPAQLDMEQTMEDVAQAVEDGKLALLLLNGECLWGTAGSAGDNSNHAVVVTGVARDTEEHEVLGFCYLDFGSGVQRWIKADVVRSAWESTGGWAIVTSIANDAF